nr:heavy metal-associated isoprenylated plant protein 31 [Ipomoea batatas]
MQMVVVRVPTLDCDGCAAKIRKALLKLKGNSLIQFMPGVDDVDIEMEMKKITVRGYGLEERKVVKALKRAGKVAEPWPYPVGSSHLASFYRYPTQIAAHYYQSMISSSADLAAPAVHAFFHTPALYSVAVAPDEAFASLFSDDNPHACTIM